MAENTIIHEISLAGYKATSTGGMLDLGTWGSYGIEKLHLTLDAAWQDLTITAFFNVKGEVVGKALVGKDGYADVPWEATKENTFAGRIVFEGSMNNQRRISANLNFKVTNHSEITDSDPVPTDDRWNQFVTENKEYRDSAFEAAKRANARAEDAEAASEDAQAAARAAKASEDAAKVSENAAAASEGNAKISAGAAAVSEGNAAASADKAKASETAATESANNAAEDAAKAASAAKKAADESVAANIAAIEKMQADVASKQTAAAASEKAAAASAVAAAGSAAQAETQKTAAEKSASDAQGYMQTASGAATAANASAENAAESKAAAGNSASAAAGSEQASVASEVKAAESERAAKASEQAAAKSAQAALESKTAAATSEVNAAASAKKAQDVSDSLPADYTAMSNDVGTLKNQMQRAYPDDSTIGEKPWSSKNIVDMLCQPLEESGNPVVCYPVAGYPLGVKAKWEPMQEGTGTPSPENIRPIKGRDSVTVERCGENLLNFPQIKTWTQYDESYTLKLKAGTYYLSCGNVVRGGANNPVIAFSDENLITWKYLNQGMKEKIQLEKDCQSFALYSNGYDFYGSAGVTATVEDLMLVAGNEISGVYTPYIGQTNTLTLPETVYGGEVDAVSGDAKETWKMLTLDGTEEWRKINEYCEASYRDLGIPSSKADIEVGKLSQHADRYIIDNAYANTSADKCAWVYSTIANHFAILRIRHKAEQSTLENWKAYLAAQYAAGTPVQIAYKLAEPVPFTATGAQPIPALAGANTVLTDADSATVTGRADPIKRITDLEAAVASIN